MKDLIEFAKGCAIGLALCAAITPPAILIAGVACAASESCDMKG